MRASAEESTLSTDLSQRDAVALAHALVAEAAQRSGVRAVVIKGPVAATYGLRRDRVSADVDVLVEPQGVAILKDELVRRGWHPPVERSVPRVLEQHSITLVNDVWPCSIDVHRSFPGLFADPEVTFDVLWRGRTVVQMGHLPISAPSRAGMAVILALHSLRSPTEVRSRTELPWLSAVIASEFTDEERGELVRLVCAGRAQWVMRDVVSAVTGREADDDATPEEKQSWELNQLAPQDKSAFLWRREASVAIHGGQLLRLWRAVWIRRADVPRSIVSELPSRREHWRYQVERWGRGLRALFDSRAG